MKPNQQEQALLEHYRQHTDIEPSPQLDAVILAAARAHLNASKPRWTERLLRTVKLISTPLPWGYALAGLATMGIALNLTFKSVEMPSESLAVIPARPTLAPSAPLHIAPEPIEDLQQSTVYHAGIPQVEAPVEAFNESQQASAAAPPMPATLQNTDVLQKPAQEPLSRASLEASSALFEAKDASKPAAKAKVNSLSALTKAEQGKKTKLHAALSNIQAQQQELQQSREALQKDFPELDIDAALENLPTQP